MRALTPLLVMVAGASPTPLRPAEVVAESGGFKVTYVEENGAQLLSSDRQRLTLWPANTDGRLHDVTHHQSSDFQVLHFTGSDGDSNMHTWVAWNPKTGALTQLLRTSDFDTVLSERATELTISLTAIEGAPGFGTFQLEPKSTQRACAQKIAEVAKLQKQAAPLLGTSGTPSDADTKALKALETKLRRRTFHFGFKNHALVSVRCD